MSLLELHNVSKTYGQGPTEVHALCEVVLSVDAGELVAVMGASGSGKSTLLTIAGSLEDPTSGDVLVDGAALSRMSHDNKARLRRRSIGYVFQDYNLLVGLSALENVAMPLELDGVPTKKAQAAGMVALEELGLGDRASRFPDEPQAASASGSRSPAPSWGNAICCWQTSPRAPLIRPTASR